MAIDLRLTKYEQALSIVDATGDAWDLKTFPGTTPILVRKDQGVIVVTQKGSAVAWRISFDPPAPILPTLLERPQVERKRDPASTVKWITTWTYVMAAAAGDTIDFVAASKYPTTLAFTEVA